MEMLDIVDEDGNPTGKTVDREIAHQQGILHRTSHVWLLRQKENQIQILLQKRSHQKDSYPGCYDISSAGHIPAGSDFRTSAIRELKEELGYDAKEEELIDCGVRHFEFQDIFHGKFFHDHQVSRIYVLWVDQESDDFVLQTEEVSEVKWFDFDDCFDKIKNNLIPHCIYIEELEMVQKQIREEF